MYVTLVILPLNICTSQGFLQGKNEKKNGKRQDSEIVKTEKDAFSLIGLNPMLELKYPHLAFGLVCIIVEKHTAWLDYSQIQKIIFS